MPLPPFAPGQALPEPRGGAPSSHRRFPGLGLSFSLAGTPGAQAVACKNRAEFLPGSDIVKSWQRCTPGTAFYSVSANSTQTKCVCGAWLGVAQVRRTAARAAHTSGGLDSGPSNSGGAGSARPRTWRRGRPSIVDALGKGDLFMSSKRLSHSVKSELKSHARTMRVVSPFKLWGLVACVGVR